MQVTRITTPEGAPEHTACQYTDEQLVGDLNYYRAEKLTKKLLEKGLITDRQYELIMAENRRTFKPFLAEIL